MEGSVEPGDNTHYADSLQSDKNDVVSYSGQHFFIN